MATEEVKDRGSYFNVLADGKFHLEVPENVGGAVLREYETSDGKQGSKWEKLYESVSGLITKVDFHDGNFGKSMLLTIEDEGYEPIIVSLNTSSNFGEDMLKKIMKLDITLPVKLVPYALTDEKTGRSKKGMTVYQNGEKVTSYFHEYDSVNKKTTVINGFPHVPVAKGKKPISSDEWKLYFAQARLFMIDEVSKKFGLDEDTAVVKTGESEEDLDAIFNGMGKKE